MKTAFPRTQWHRLLGRLLEALLSPVGISVETEVTVLADPPRADILLLRRQGKQWSEAQRQRLADGLRDTQADHLLIEFKYRESLNEEALAQLLGYDFFYRQHRKLKRKAVAGFVISSRTPTSDILKQMDYRPTDRPGVFASDHPLLKPLRIILLNQLSPSPHNVPLKCFASRRQEQQKSFAVLQDSGLLESSSTVERLIIGLWRLLMKNAPEIDELTPEYVMQVGQEWIDALLKAMPTDTLLKTLPIEEVMKYYTPAEMLAGLSAKERLEGLSIEELRRYLEQLEKDKRK